MKKYKSALKYAWITLIVTVLIAYFAFPDFFTAENLKQLLHKNDTSIKVVYVIIVLIRALVFLPSTFVLILGITLYPDSFYFLLAVNMLGIIVGSTLIYAAGKVFTPEDFFSEKHQQALPKIKEKINTYGFSIVLLWSFFPLVPTDLICYVSGATKMNYYKFILALFIGEIILVTLYLKTGQGILDLIF